MSLMIAMRAGVAIRLRTYSVDFQSTTGLERITKSTLLPQLSKKLQETQCAKKFMDKLPLSLGEGRGEGLAGKPTNFIYLSFRRTSGPLRNEEM